MASIKRDAVKQKWEETEFPLVCETCLGDNAYIRMTKEAHGKKCKICETPFTVFAWQAGTKGRLKKVEICRNCAKSKNVCQVCIYDLQYGLPVKTRDRILKENGASGSIGSVPQSHANRAWNTAQQARLLENGQNSVGEANALAHAQLQSIARMEPRYERNMAKLCSFFARGECNRGATCPFRHEMPRDRNDPLSKQNTKDRFFGTNDPVAAKLYARMKRKQEEEQRKMDEKQNGSAEDDGFERARSTLYLRIQGDAPYPHLSEQIIRDTFYSFGEIISVRSMPDRGQAFVEYTQPEATELAIASMNRKTLLGRTLFVAWARAPKRGADLHMERKSANASDSASTSRTRTKSATRTVGTSEVPANKPHKPQRIADQVSLQANREPVVSLDPPGGGAGAGKLPGGFKVSSNVAALVAARKRGGRLETANAQRQGGGPIRRERASTRDATRASASPYYPSSDPGRLGSRAISKNT